MSRVHVQRPDSSAVRPRGDQAFRHGAALTRSAPWRPGGRLAAEGHRFTTRSSPTVDRVSEHSLVDTDFDLRTDAGFTSAGRPRDPDQFSRTLRRYHRLLWSKPLPNGVGFELTDTRPGVYLYHHSALGEFFLASDSIIHTLTGLRGMSAIIDRLPHDGQEEFHRLGYTIGGMILFPGNRIDGKPTLNGARGMHPGIRDRFDHTLECIRRHFEGETSNPLGEAISRYSDFFALFETFRGYVDFFLLQDLVTTDYAAVRTFTEFDGFPTSPLPRTVECYLGYRDRCIAFVQARNRRIATFAS
jgi:hypothetical protein